jgi:hypothetical protein
LIGEETIINTGQEELVKEPGERYMATGTIIFNS